MLYKSITNKYSKEDRAEFASTLWKQIPIKTKMELMLGRSHKIMGEGDGNLFLQLSANIMGKRGPFQFFIFLEPSDTYRVVLTKKEKILADVDDVYVNQLSEVMFSMTDKL